VNQAKFLGETIAAKLIGEIGDVRRFESKRSLVAYAGVDPGKNDSGRKVSASGKISRSGDALIRKAVFQAVECYLLNSPADEPVYQFLDKKRSEGKLYYVYMTAAGNKFLRIYYARVSEYLNSLETANNAEAPASATEENDLSERITSSPIADTNIAFTCEQDSAPVETDASGSQDFAYTNGAASSSTCEKSSARAGGCPLFSFGK
jgi:hypothetical protein